METLLYLHAGATLFMTGLIWFVQVVHYPLFLRVGEGNFQIPLHRRLLTSYDPRVVEQLVHSNWFRTFGWTLRAALALWMLRPSLLG